MEEEEEEVRVVEEGGSTVSQGRGHWGHSPWGQCMRSRWRGRDPRQTQERTHVPVPFLVLTPVPCYLAVERRRGLAPRSE